MMIKKTFVASIILVLWICSFSFSQTGVSNVNFQTTSDNRIEISYDLTGYAASARFTVSVGVSLDNGRSFTLFPKALTGDVGAGISPGRNKTITWDVFRDTPVLISDEMVIQVLAKQETPTTPSRLQPAPARPRSDVKKKESSDVFGEWKYTIIYSDIKDEQCAVEKIRGIDANMFVPDVNFGLTLGFSVQFWSTNYSDICALVYRLDIGPQLMLLGLRTYLTVSPYCFSWPLKGNNDHIVYYLNIYGINYGLEYRLFLDESLGLSFCYEVSSFIGQTANIGYKQFGFKNHRYSTFKVGFIGRKMRN